MTSLLLCGSLSPRACSPAIRLSCILLAVTDVGTAAVKALQRVYASQSLQLEKLILIHNIWARLRFGVGGTLAD